MTVDRSSNERILWVLGVIAVAAVGIYFRVTQMSPMHGLGFDENFYRAYVNQISDGGLSNYPKIVNGYIDYQKTLSYSVLPPLRFLYILTSYLWKSCFHVEALVALKSVATTFSVLTMGLSFVFALRLGGKAAGLGVLALTAVAPTQLHMSQHALVDGFFTFWALLTFWSLWENLQKPDSPAWQCLYSLSLTLMMMTKENSAFVFVAIMGVFLANRWLKFGTLTPRLLLLTVAGPLLGVFLLMTAAGGLGTFLETYRLSVSKNFLLPFAIKTGDGPWHRYIVDLLLVSPVIMLLAIAEIFQLNLARKAQWYLTLFILCSYLIMANLKYAMNLRYANMWDMPLRFLAFSQLATLSGCFGRRRNLVLAIGIILICALELRQYYALAVNYPLYELVPEGLLRALKILK